MIPFLVIGRGAMGLLHAKYLEDAGHPVALYNPHELLHPDFSCYGVKKYQEKDIQMLKAKSLDVEGAKQFLQKNGNTSLTGVFVAVKAHHIRSTLVPFVDTLPKVSSIILLHNGLLDRPTDDFLDQVVPNSAATMISSLGSMLLSHNERPPVFARVSCEMGPGPSFVFPRSSVTDEAMIILRAVAKDLLISPSKLVAFPNCTLVTTEQGQLEQYLKLSVNVAINGLLARVALRDWYSSHGTLPVRRITNKEVLPELPLAQSIARLTLHCAASIKKNENNYLLQKAVKNDEAARRVESTIFKVLDNVCSTVVDICNGRVTEREALFSMLLEELPQLPEAKESVSIHLHEASLALQEINDMLASWDNHIIP
jgi:ketopantoate reductase